MNYLDLLPDDVMKIINRKVHNAQIIKRKIERKENKRIAEQNKLKADIRRIIFEKYAGLYRKYLFVSKQEYLDKLYDKVLLTFGRTLIHTEFFHWGEKPYLKITYLYKDNIVYAKFY